MSKVRMLASATLGLLLSGVGSLAHGQDGLLVHYELDETSGSIATDSSGNGYHGTYVGSPQLTGALGASLDGVADHVQLPNDILAGLSSITVSMDVWIRSEQGTPYFIFGLGNPATGSSGDGYLFATGDAYRAAITTGNWSGEVSTNSGSNLPREAWNTITYTLDDASDTAVLYLNGSQVASTSDVTTTPGDIGAGSTSSNYIGRSNYDSDQYLAGSVRNFRIYDSALSAEEVATLVPDLTPQQLADEAAAALTVTNIEDVRGNLTLPTASYGLPVSWSSANPDVVSATGVVERQAQDTSVVLTATVSNGDASTTRTFTAQVRAAIELEPLEGYAFAYFTGSGIAGEKIYFAASRGNDALSWDELNGGEPLFTSSAGTGGLRDPFIIRSPEGDTFYMIATDLSIGSGTSWDESQRAGSLYIEVWESHDLVNWSAQRHVKVSPDNAGNTWAPEAYYDETLGAYVVFWASKLYEDDDPDHTASTYNRMLYTTTRDFVSFTEPQIWQDGISRIDSTVIKDDSVYHRFTKDEGAGTTGCSDIIQESSTDLLAPLTGWTMVASCIGANAGTSSVEGPSIFRSNPGDVNGDYFYLFVDEYGGRGYIPLRTTDLDSANWAVAPTYDLPTYPRHGTVLPVTAAELASLREQIIVIEDAKTNALGEVVRYNFEQSSSTTLTDVSGNGYDGTIMGGATLADGELVLDGVDDYVELPDNLLTGVDDITVEAEVYINEAQGTPYFIYGLGNTASDAGDGYLFATGNPYRTSISTGNWSAEQTVNQGDNLPRDAWVHLTYTLSGDTATMYLNGAQVASGTVTIDPSDIRSGQTLDNYLGRSNYTSDQLLSGRFREFAIYNRALSASEVLTLSGNTSILADVQLTDPSILVIDPIVDADNHTVVFVVEPGTDVSAVAPVFMTADGVQSSPAAGTVVDLSSPVQYTLSGAADTVWTMEVIEKRTPVLPGLYADPNIAAFGDTYYIYATTDGFDGWGGQEFYVWSSPNLVDWTRSEEPILTLDGENGDVPWATGNAWAPTIIERGGQYFFYFSGHNPTYDRKTIGVAVADAPEGPFVAESTAMILNNEEVTSGQAIDPAAFQDPVTGTYYLFWGNGNNSPLYAQLSADMTSLVPGTITLIEGLPSFREGLFVNYREGLYHLTYAIDDTGSVDYRVGYATSTSVDGPWTSQGIILSKDPSKGLLGTGHSSILNVPGTDDWYIAYHRFAIPDGDGTHRETTIDYLEFDPDTGLIIPVTPTLIGVEPQEIVLPGEDDPEDDDDQGDGETAGRGHGHNQGQGHGHGHGHGHNQGHGQGRGRNQGHQRGHNQWASSGRRTNF